MRKAVLGMAASALVALATAAPAQQASVGPVAAPRVMMLRLFVSDLTHSEKFYHDVLGANVVQKMGDHVRIMMFAGGTPPGIILIQSSDIAQRKGSFVLQVPDLEATLALAATHGGKVEAKVFSQGVQNMPAQSRHMSDPDGNDIEILQIGKPK